MTHISDSPHETQICLLLCKNVTNILEKPAAVIRVKDHKILILGTNLIHM